MTRNGEKAGDKWLAALNLESECDVSPWPEAHMSKTFLRPRAGEGKVRKSEKLDRRVEPYYGTSNQAELRENFFG
jgi:hypothetical protein